MAVHFLTHEYRPFPGGIACYIAELSRACAQAGVDTEVWAPGYGQVGSFMEDGVLTHRIAMPARQDWWSRMRLRGALRRERPEGLETVVLAEPGPIRLWMAADRLRLPPARRIIVILHGTELKQLAGGRQKAGFAALLERASVVGVVSGAVERELQQFFPALKTPVVRVPGAVRSEWARLDPGPRGLPAGPLKVLQVGRITPRKGQDLTVEAVTMLPMEWRNRVQVRIVGRIGRKRYFKGLERRIRATQLPVDIVGEVNDAALVEQYRWADAVLFPSRDAGPSMEGLGLAALEAGHFGLPVIGTRVGGIPEAVHDGRSGRLVEPDALALRDALLECLQNPERCLEWGKNGAEFVRTSFSWKKNLVQLGIV